MMESNVTEENICGESCLSGEPFLSDVVGTCVGGICICPGDSYDGLDDWQDFNDCHINKRTRSIVRLVALSITILTLIIGILLMIFLARRKDSCMFHLTRRFRRFWCANTSHHQPAKGQRRSSANSSNDIITIATGMTLKTEEEQAVGRMQDQALTEFTKSKPKATVKNAHSQSGVGTTSNSNRERIDARVGMFIKRRHRGDVARVFDANMRLSVLCLLVIFYASGNIMYISALEFGNAMLTQDGAVRVIVDLGRSISTSCIVAAIWFLADSFYKTIPDLRLFGKLLNVNSLLVTFPHAFPIVCHSFIIIGSAIIYLFGVILPQVVPRKRVDWETGMLLSLVILAVSVLFVSGYVLRLLRKAFLAIQATTTVEITRINHLLKEFKSRTENNTLKKMKSIPLAKSSLHAASTILKKPSSTESKSALKHINNQATMRSQSRNETITLFKNDSTQPTTKPLKDVNNNLGIDSTFAVGSGSLSGMDTETMKKLSSKLKSTERIRAEISGTLRFLTTTFFTLFTVVGLAAVFMVCLALIDTLRSNLYIFYSVIIIGTDFGVILILSTLGLSFYKLDEMNDKSKVSTEKQDYGA